MVFIGVMVVGVTLPSLRHLLSALPRWKTTREGLERLDAELQAEIRWRSEVLTQLCVGCKCQETKGICQRYVILRFCIVVICYPFDEFQVLATKRMPWERSG